MSSRLHRPEPKGLDPSSPLKDFTDGIITRFLTDCQHPLASRLLDAFRKKDYSKLTASSIDPADYGSSHDFAVDYLLTSFLKKFRDFDLGIDREAAAYQKWLVAEESCNRTNFFFRNLWSSGDNPFPARVHQSISLMQQKISQILGEVDYSFIRKNCRFGPGSDGSTQGQKTSAYNKFAHSGDLTPGLLEVVADVFSEDHREDFSHESELVRGNRLSFVPKTALIDRAICTEPRWNIYLQLGIGELISTRLKRYGLDITSQDRNRELARLAHVYGLATIDLSSASDTVSKNLVLELFPEEWSDLIFKTRSPQAFYRGKWIKMEKVSSMGNGYTFPVESLIFYAACWAACRLANAPECIGVFGDDLIVPQEVAPSLIELLSYLGFSTNVQKSFLSGRFFESCGKDYFDGVNVRPFFIKERISRAEDLMILANQITEYMRRLPDVATTLNLSKLWHYVVSLVPQRLRLFGPIGLAGVIHSTFDRCTPRPAPNGWEGWMIPTWVPVAVKQWGSSYRGHLFSKLSGDIDTGQFFVNRSNVRWKKKVTYVPTYADFLWA